jgi:hypothetical protein
MASPPIPPSLEHLATRPFSFYPPIIGVEHNEWLFRKATWSEILVVNCKSSAEVWIPRRFVGEVSRVDDPVLIVGLARELELKAGSVWPYQRRVIEMPMAVGGFPIPPPEASTDRGGPAPIVGIRLETSDKRIFKLIGGALVVFIGLYVLAVNMNRVGEVRQRSVQYTTKDQQFLDLTSRDDYFVVVQKMGPPATDRWRNESAEIQYRALSYPDRNYTVILMGQNRATVRYIGALDDKWVPVHSVELHSGVTTSSLLRALPRF